VQPGRNKTDLVLTSLIGVLTVVFVIVVAGSLKPKIVNQGDTAPNFTITTDQGRTITRSDFGGKLLVLNFWASWCGPCVQETPSLNEFARRYAGQGVVVLGVSVDRKEDKYRDFLKKMNVQFLTARDPDAKLSSRFGTFMYPETYIIDRNGTVLYKIAAAQDWMDPSFLNLFQSFL
jgi:cytochrome c biogenesis protein CcmG, thiol:disulfide interchange protein DsbE